MDKGASSGRAGQSGSGSANILSRIRTTTASKPETKIRQLEHALSTAQAELAQLKEEQEALAEAYATLEKERDDEVLKLKAEPEKLVIVSVALGKERDGWKSAALNPEPVEELKEKDTSALGAGRSKSPPTTASKLALEKLVIASVALGKEKDGWRLVQVPTPKQERVARWHIVVLCWSLFLIGWSDASAGPLLHDIMETYKMNSEQVSYSFIIACISRMIGQVLNVPVVDRIGIGRTMLYCTGIQVVALALQGLPNVNYPVFLFLKALNGGGVSIIDAQANAFVAVLKHGTDAKMAYLHAAYGFGTLVSLLSAAYLSATLGWRTYFFFSSLLTCTSLLSFVLVFGSKTEDELLLDAGEPIPEASGQNQSSSLKYSQILRSKAVHATTVFIILYVGVEVIIVGWMETFMLLRRGGSAASGYVIAAFVGGLTFGRLFLLPASRKIGNVRSVYVYAALSVVFEIVVWQVPSFYVGFAAVFVVGTLLGPMYPIVINHAAKVLPRHLVAGAIGWIGASGAGGVMLFPFITESMLWKLEFDTVHPLLLVLLSSLVFVWMAVPTKSYEPQAPTQVEPEAST